MPAYSMQLWLGPGGKTWHTHTRTLHRHRAGVMHSVKASRPGDGRMCTCWRANRSINDAWHGHIALPTGSASPPAFASCRQRANQAYVGQLHTKGNPMCKQSLCAMGECQRGTRECPEARRTCTD